MLDEIQSPILYKKMMSEHIQRKYGSSICEEYRQKITQKYKEKQDEQEWVNIDSDEVEFTPNGSRTQGILDWGHTKLRSTITGIKEKKPPLRASIYKIG